MGALEQAIEKAIQAHVDRLRLAQIITGTATKVGETTCTVTRDDAPELTDVRLNAIDDNLQSFFTVYPKKGSNVLVGIIEGIKTEAVVLRCSEVESVKFKTGENTFVFDSSGMKLNGTELIDWINKAYNDMQALKTLLQNTPIAGNGAPAAIVFTPTVTQIQ
jgi:phage gp45-like